MGLANTLRLCYNQKEMGMWLSWLARFAHIEEVGGSSPFIPTTKEASFVYQDKRGFSCSLWQITIDMKKRSFCS